MGDSRASDHLQNRGGEPGEDVASESQSTDPILTAVDDNGLPRNKCGIVAC
jgi:hypothetical protein